MAKTTFGSHFWYWAEPIGWYAKYRSWPTYLAKSLLVLIEVWITTSVFESLQSAYGEFAKPFLILVMIFIPVYLAVAALLAWTGYKLRMPIPTKS
ncbi:MAG: hypothetical protein IPN91_07345 [Holophagaceae bacterium]|jgi:hypothetical protein|uniref:Uncharacterized protein n=1 Tax=Candidatus Geothrix odensensis TaxID=2954440 RepID=A0A936F1K6_9BACT|nr:hypothetical protein [Candidatus Geothrix odensensis]